MQALAHNARGLNLLWRLNMDRLLMAFALGLALVGGHAMGTILTNI